MNNNFKDGYLYMNQELNVQTIGTTIKIEDVKNRKFKIFEGNEYFSNEEKRFINELEDFSKDFDYQNGPDLFHENEPWVQTYSGRRFNPLNPIIESIVIQDIAHSLSLQCRFTGNCNEFYSVAQHSVIVSYFCLPEDALHGLLHDASEFALSDISSPIKHDESFSDYRVFEHNLMDAIYTRFGLSITEPESVKRADKLVLAMEARDLMKPLRKDWLYPIKPPPVKIEPLSPIEAEKLFMERFYELIGAPELGKLWKK